METCNQEEVWEYRTFRDEEGTYSVIAVQLQDGKIVEATDDCCPFRETPVELEEDLEEMLRSVRNCPVLTPWDLNHLDEDHNVFRMNNVVEGVCGFRLF